MCCRWRFQKLVRCSDEDLIRQIEFLKSENEMLRRQIAGNVRLTVSERKRLIKLGTAIESGVAELITIVHPKTFERWVREEREQQSGEAKPKTPRKRGRPRTAEEVEAIVCRLAEENDWGYTRIHGELKKLGFSNAGRSTVRDILKRKGFDTGPKRGKGSWDQFVSRQAQTMWAADFLSVKAWTSSGIAYLYALAFIHIGSRRVWVSPCTLHPNGEWTAQQAKNFMMHLEEQEDLEVGYVLRDRDSKYICFFDEVFKSSDAKVVKLPVRSPNLNAYVERFVQTIKHECLNHFVIFGRKHMDHLVSEFVDYYHHQRPHQGKGMGNQPPIRLGEPPPPPEMAATGEIVCEERLGGLLKHYYRKAA